MFEVSSISKKTSGAIIDKLEINEFVSHQSFLVSSAISGCFQWPSKSCRVKRPGPTSRTTWSTRTWAPGAPWRDRCVAWTNNCPGPPPNSLCLGPVEKWVGKNTTTVGRFLVKNNPFEDVGCTFCVFADHSLTKRMQMFGKRIDVSWKYPVLQVSRNVSLICTTFEKGMCDCGERYHVYLFTKNLSLENLQRPRAPLSRWIYLWIVLCSDSNVQLICIVQMAWSQSFLTKQARLSRGQTRDDPQLFFVGPPWVQQPIKD